MQRTHEGGRGGREGGEEEDDRRKKKKLKSPLDYERIKCLIDCSMFSVRIGAEKMAPDCF